MTQIYIDYITGSFNFGSLIRRTWLVMVMPFYVQQLVASDVDCKKPTLWGSLFRIPHLRLRTWLALIYRAGELGTTIYEGI